MSLNTYNVIYLISNFFTIFIIHRFVKTFFNKRKCNKIISSLAYLSYFIFTSLAYIFLDIPMITLCMNCVIVFLISLTYEASFQKRLIYVTYIIMFMLVPEVVIGAVTGYFHFSVFTEGNYSDSIGIITARILTYIEALLVKNFKSRKKNQNVGWISWISSILIPISTLISEIILVSCNDLTKAKAIATVVLLFAVNIASFYLYDSLTESYVQRSKLSIMEKENELYCKQCEIMQSSTEELQAFRHDMNNQFIALSQLLFSKKYEEAEIYLSKLSNLTKDSIMYSTSGNVVIDGLINYKLQNAASDNIKVKTEIAVPKQLQIETTDIIVILGNLLDNAMTAIVHVEKEQRILTLKIIFSQERLIIRITNPYNGDIKCEDDRIITSKKDRQQHGYGLVNVSKVVDKYKGYIEIDYTNGIFTVDIIMYTQN